MKKDASPSTPRGGRVKVGDLAVVVTPNHCRSCPPKNIGRIFVVEKIRPATGENWRCMNCGFRMPHYGGVVAIGAGWKGNVNRLKRIPPIEELEGQPTQEDIREPA